MNESVYGFQADYIHRLFNFAVLFREQGLSEAELSAVQIKFILGNSIPGMLPLHIEYHNADTKLLYDITGKRKLAHCIDKETFTEFSFLSMLLSLVNTLEDSRNYMLSERCYLLRRDFIYVGQGLSDLYLTYVPLKAWPEKKDVQEELCELSETILAETGLSAHKELDRLLLFMREHTFSIAECKKRIIAMLELLVSLQPPVSTAVSDFQSPEKIGGQSIEHPIDQLGPGSDEARRKPAPNTFVPSLLDAGHRERDRFKVSGTQLSHWAAYLFAAAACAAVWAAIKGSGEAILHLKLGLSLFIVDAVFALLHIWNPFSKRALAGGIPLSTAAGNRECSGQAGPGKVQAAPIDVQKYMKDYYDSLPYHTSPLPLPDATVFLHPSKMTERKPVFEVRREDKLETVAIAGSSFIVGRGPNDVQYAENKPGVSRVHFEVNNENGAYSVRDLGSKNGTLLNGERLVAYKSYPLNDGDKVKMIQTEFVFTGGG